ncbi:hypothetical protein D3C86_1194910 [compost metagenome]
MLAPSCSMAVAISGADFEVVPWVSRPAVRAATPGLPAGSLAEPALKFRRAETRGRPSVGATRTRMPLARRKSATAGVAGATSAPGWGRRARSASGSRTATGPAGASSATVTGALTFIFCTLAGWASSAGR